MLIKAWITVWRSLCGRYPFTLDKILKWSCCKLLFTTKLTCQSNFSLSPNITPRFFTDYQITGVKGPRNLAGKSARPHLNITISVLSSFTFKKFVVIHQAVILVDDLMASWRTYLFQRATQDLSHQWWQQTCMQLFTNKNPSTKETVDTEAQTCGANLRRGEPEPSQEC